MLTARVIVDSFGYASLAKVLGLPAGTVSAWKTRNAIPQPYWRQIETEARLRGVGITYSDLESSARPPRSRRAASLEGHA